jgi:hypothetical protein
MKMDKCLKLSRSSEQRGKPMIRKGGRLRMSTQSRQPRSPEAPLSEEEIRATIDDTVESVRDFLRMLVRLAGMTVRPGEPKP